MLELVTTLGLKGQYPQLILHPLPWRATSKVLQTLHVKFCNHLSPDDNCLRAHATLFRDLCLHNESTHLLQLQLLLQCCMLLQAAVAAAVVPRLHFDPHQRRDIPRRYCPLAWDALRLSYIPAS